MSIKSSVEAVKDSNPSVAAMSMALQTRTLFGIPFHIIDLAITIALLVGCLFFDNTSMVILCVILAVYFAWGAWVDYYKYRDFWRVKNKR